MNSQLVKKGRSSLDRAAMALGAASVASIGLAVAPGRFQIIELRSWSWSMALAVGLGACAVVAGLLGRRSAVAATGALFLMAAVIQVPVWGSSNNWLGGNGSTASLWLGIGLSLLTLGLADRIWPQR